MNRAARISGTAKTGQVWASASAWAAYCADTHTPLAAGMCSPSASHHLPLVASSCSATAAGGGGGGGQGLVMGGSGELEVGALLGTGTGTPSLTLGGQGLSPLPSVHPSLTSCLAPQPRATSLGDTGPAGAGAADGLGMGAGAGGAGVVQDAQDVRAVPIAATPL